MTAALIVDFEEKSSTGPIAAEEGVLRPPLKPLPQADSTSCRF